MNKALLILTILAVFAAGGLAFAADPSVERIVKSMDRRMDEGKLPEVIAEAKARVEMADTAANRYLLGRAYGMAEEYEKAREQFEFAFERDPGSAYAYHGLGAYHLVMGDLDAAERNLKSAVQRDERFTRAHMELGKLYMAKQDRLAAQRQFVKVLNYEPGNNAVRTLLAYQYLKDKRWESAADEFLVVLGKDADHVGALKGLAVTLSMQRRTKEAIERFERVLELNPRDLDSYVFLTNIYRGQGKKEEAIGVLERVLEILPENSPNARAVREEIQNIREGRMSRDARVTLPLLLEQLKTGSPEVRREAMARLISVDPQPAPRAMVRAVMDKDPVVRTMSIRWVGRTGGLMALALLEILARHPEDREKNQQVRATVAQSIGTIGDAGGIPVLVALLDDESFRVFKAAVFALRDLTGIICAEDDAKPIAEANREVLTKKWNAWWAGPRALATKLAAIETIGALSSRRMSRYLIVLLGDPEALVAGKARKAFAAATGVTIGTEEDAKTKEGRTRLAKEAVLALEKLKRMPRKPKKTEGD